jgi:2'-5' RNA ligase superfamily
MKCALALLFDRRIDDLVNELAWKAHCTYGLGISCRRLPAHVSLKQPFHVGDGLNSLSRVLPIFERFARRIKPIPITFSKLKRWRDVVQYPAGPEGWLRRQHNALNALLGKHIDDPSAPFDGDAYRFHMTISIGGPTTEMIRASTRELGGALMPAAVPTHLGVFAYTNEGGPDGGSYLTIRSFPLSQLWS